MRNVDVEDERKEEEEDRSRNRHQMVSEIVDLFWSNAPDKQASVTDFIRLVSLERDLEAERPVREVKAGWVSESARECWK